MSKLYWMITITDRSRLVRFVTLYEKAGLDLNLIMLGFGTANREMLDLFGLENNEKVVVFSVVTDSFWHRLKKKLIREMHIEVPGTGIAFITPIASVGGIRELTYLTAGQDFKKEAEATLKDTKNELLIIISNQRYSDLVMDAACGAGAAGGTVLHAKGTGTKTAERFLGISLASEKDIILIVTKTSDKKAIMRAIMEKAGMNSPAKAIVFSLPVTETAGLTLLEEAEEEAGPSQT